MKIGIIIPVVQVEMVDKLLYQLANGIKKPDIIVIIDVSKDGMHLSDGVYETVKFLRYRRIMPDQNLSYYKPAFGTNEAWTLGYNILKQYIPYYGIVGFLNDDIEINPYFLQSISLAYSTHKNTCHLLYPQTVNCPEKVQTAQLSYTKLRRTKSRYGYAWFLPRTIFDKIPPFPENCKIWYGDNWVMVHLRHMAYNLHINIGNFIYHHGGTSSKQLKADMAGHGLNLSKQRREEHKEYLRAVRKWRGQDETN